MADISVHSNTPLQPKAAANPYVRRPEGLLGYAGEVIGGIWRPFQTAFRWSRYKIAPADNPQEALGRIGTIANVGLDRAALRGIKIGPEAAQKLFTVAVPSKAELGTEAAVGPVADISPLPKDPRVTRAPDMQAQVEDPNHWKNELQVNQRRLEEKIGAHTALLQMCARCDLKLKGQDYLALMNIVKRFTEGNGEKKSLWDFFSEFTASRPVSFFQKLKAGWFYFFYYYTSILTQTVKAYLRPAVKNLTDDLIKENSAVRSLVFQKVIENINDFLQEDTSATENYANKKEHGSLKTLRDQAIERHYGFSLPELCKAFSDKRINEDNPNVELFETAKLIPFIGYFFKGLEYLINRFIIRSNMKSWILPSALESTVNTGLDGTRYIPFKLNLTRFLTLQLKNLKVELDTQGPTTKPVGPMQGTELLGDMIEKLMMALELEPLGDNRIKLRKKFQEFEDGKWNPIDKKIEGSIKNGVIDASHLLFKYLNETAQSGELFARLLDLSCAPFSGEETSENVLEDQLIAEKKHLQELCKYVGGKIVTKAVAEEVNGQQPEDVMKLAHDTFDAGKVTANKALEELHVLCRRMTEKIDQSAHKPTAENNIQQDIAYFLQIMQVFAKQKEVHQAMNEAGLNELDRDAIWRIVTPLYEKAAAIEERVLKLQGLQDHYPTHSAVEQQLKLINDLLRSIHDQFTTQPRHLQTHLIQTLGVAAEEISRCLGSKAEVTVTTNRNIKQVADLTESVSKRQKIIDAIHTFYPPRLSEQETASEGLLDQLLNYERGVHPSGFKPSRCLKEIAKNLEHFPPEEKRELGALIGNGSNLKSKWTQLGATLQRIYERHMGLQKQEHLELGKALDKAVQFAREMILKYSIIKEKDHNKMQAEIGAIAQQVSSLQDDVSSARLSLPPLLSSTGAKLTNGSIWSTTGGGIGWLAATGLGWLFERAATHQIGAAIVATLPTAILPLGAAIIGALPMGAAIVGASVGAFAGEHSLARPDEKESWPKLKFAVGGLGLIGAAIAGSPVGAAAGSIYAGWHVKRAVQSWVRNRVESKLLDIFGSAYKLSSENSRIYKMAATRTLAELAKA